METQGIQTRIPEDFSQVLAILLVLQMNVFEKVLFEQHCVHNNAGLDQETWNYPTMEAANKKVHPKRELLVNNYT